MQLHRDLTVKINRLLDDWLPPAIRDWRWPWVIPLRLLYGSRSRTFLDFRVAPERMSADDLTRWYVEMEGALPHRPTHLNSACLEAIMGAVSNTAVLEVGAGGCFLAGKLAETGNQVTVCDVWFQESGRDQRLTYVQGDLLRLPFPDKQFDTVVSTHTLEHIPDVRAAMTELRRVARRRVIIVVPRQRPALHTFDPHLQFFPYRFSVLFAFGPGLGRATCDLLGGDWMYIETQ